MSDNTEDDWEFTVDAEESSAENPQKKHKSKVRGKERAQKLTLDVPKDGVTRRPRSQYFEEEKKKRRKKKKKQNLPIKELVFLIIAGAVGYWVYNNFF